jgi:hypothetical protein
MLLTQEKYLNHFGNIGILLLLKSTKKRLSESPQEENVLQKF